MEKRHYFTATTTGAGTQKLILTEKEWKGARERYLRKSRQVV